MFFLALKQTTFFGKVAVVLVVKVSKIVLETNTHYCFQKTTIFCEFISTTEISTTKIKKTLRKKVLTRNMIRIEKTFFFLKLCKKPNSVKN